MMLTDTFKLMMSYWRITFIVGLGLSLLVIISGLLIITIVQYDPVTFQMVSPFLWMGVVASLLSICFLIPATLIADLTINVILGVKTPKLTAR